MNTLFQRLSAAFLTVPSLTDWLWAIALFLAFSLLYLPIGLASGFLKVDVQFSQKTIATVVPGTLLMPGLFEELIYRVLLIPHAIETVTPVIWWLSVGLSWLLFISSHPLNPFANHGTFKNPIFLIGAALLGIACTISYIQSGSLWPPVLIHWLIVVVWLLALGGLRKLNRIPSP